MEFSFDYFFEHKFVLMTFLTVSSAPVLEIGKLFLFLSLFFRCYVSLSFRFQGAIFFDRIFNAIGIFRSPSVMFLLEILGPIRTTFPLFVKSIFQSVFIRIGSAHRFALVSTGCRREMKELCA
jgi:hypothetical protein